MPQRLVVFNHLVVNLAQHFSILRIHSTRDQKNVGVLRVARVHNAKAFGVVERRECGKHLNVAAVAA